MEKLLAIRNDLENTLRQIDTEPGYLETLYCQKSIQESIFWIGKLIERLDSEK